MCALVKPKDIPFETQCLEKRIAFIKELKECLRKDSQLVTATVDLYSQLLEDILQDVCLDVHRDTAIHDLIDDPSGMNDVDSFHAPETKSTKGVGKGELLTEQEKIGGGGKRSGATTARHAHRDVHVESQAPEEESLEKVMAKAAIHFGSATMLGIQMSGSKGAVDMFGNMIQPVALDQVSCPNCGRKIASGRFAPHLEKCMGGGRLAARTS